MNVVQIGHRGNQEILETLNELTELATNGHVKGFVYGVEIGTGSAPRYGVVGRFHSDPIRGLGALTRLREKLLRIADWQERYRRR